jgi:para-aminobenzoate synthetase/4-amino-4-deoxychorismate lyase
VRHPFTVQVQTGAGEWLSCSNPDLVLQADTPEAVRRTLVDVEQLTRDRGLHAAGFVTYEAGAAFDLVVHPADRRIPLAWFGLFEPAAVNISGPPERGGDYTLGPLTPSIDRATFDRAFDRIKAHLAAGDTYQVNYTFAMTGRFDGDPASLFADLCAAQQGRYGAFIDLGDVVIGSASPELFFEFRGLEVLARPMKGTAPRGLTARQDRDARDALHASPKNRAENVMVVDMVRNDLGRIAEVGSVQVPELFIVERYPNVWQMTSLVTGRTAAPLDEVFAALHPSASVTGAPKVRTMELLRELEPAPRGVYTGAIGHVPPNGLARFNVAIRTAVVDRRQGTIAFGVGSGIVWDSDAAAEWAECLLKGSVLAARPQAFDLLETLGWDPERGYTLLEAHLKRMMESGEYFNRPVAEDDLRFALAEAVTSATVPQRVRLLVGPGGAIRTEARPHVATPEPLRVVLATEPVDATSVWLYHKTTNRDVYDRARASAPDADEVLLWNGDGQLTEATTANVIVEIDGARVTPAVSCGLLAGTWRASMLDAGEIREAIVAVDDLRRATGLWLINSVHGMRRAVLSTAVA